jgi:hypothetical protein
MFTNRPTATTPLPARMTRAALSCGPAAVGALALSATETNLGTVGGLTYIYEESNPVTAPGNGGAAASCPSGTRVLGGGAEIGARCRSPA